MRDARPNTDQRLQALATPRLNYARAITRAEVHHRPNRRYAMAELECAATNVALSVAIKTVRKSIIKALDFVTALAIFICANVNILAKTVKCFWNKQNRSILSFAYFNFDV